MARFFSFFSLMFLILSLAGLNLIAAEDRRGLIQLSGKSDRDAVAPQLDGVDELPKKENWSKAIEECQAILARQGDTLVAISPDHFVPARLLVHQRIAHLPALALKIYRARIDRQAKKWYEEGLAARDQNLIRRVVEDAFSSRYGEAALEQLGDMAFEAGRFEEALHWWRMIARPSAQVGNLPPEQDHTKALRLLFPDPQKNQALIRAKQLLALLFLRDQSESTIELRAFKALHGNSQGTLAGQKGNLVSILDDLFKNPPPPPHEPKLESWPTFGGRPARPGATRPPPDHPKWAAPSIAEPPCVFFP